MQFEVTSLGQKLIKWRYFFAFFVTVGLVLLSRASNGLANGPILCPFRLLTGYECPTCGTTRSIGSLLQGDVVGAFNNNPLGIVVSAALVWFVFAKESFTSFVARIRNRWDKASRTQQVLVVSILCSALWFRTILL